MLVIFGSAVSSGNPGDIDVAYTGAKFTLRERKLVLKWAAKRGLPADLPLDIHSALEWGGAVRLPVPYDLPLEYEVLEGERKVVAYPCKGVASAIRAFGNDPERLHEELMRLFMEGARMALGISDPRHPRNDFRGYVEGMTALKSAIAKAARWDEVWPTLPFGHLFNRLATETRAPALLYGTDRRVAPIVWCQMVEQKRMLRRSHLEARLFRDYSSYSWSPEELEAELWP